MQDKRPRNKQGQPHGYWEVTLIDGWYKGHFVNDIPKGYFEVDWQGTKIVDKQFYAL